MARPKKPLHALEKWAKRRRALGRAKKAKKPAPTTRECARCRRETRAVWLDLVKLAVNASVAVAVATITARRP